MWGLKVTRSVPEKHIINLFLALIYFFLKICSVNTKIKYDKKGEYIKVFNNISLFRNVLGHFNKSV